MKTNKQIARKALGEAALWLLLGAGIVLLVISYVG